MYNEEGAESRVRYVFNKPPASVPPPPPVLLGKVGALVGGQGAALRRLDDLASDVSGAVRSGKQSEAASAAKLDLQAHVGIVAPTSPRRTYSACISKTQMVAAACTINTTVCCSLVFVVCAKVFKTKSIRLLLALVYCSIFEGSVTTPRHYSRSSSTVYKSAKMVD